MKLKLPNNMGKKKGNLPAGKPGKPNFSQQIITVVLIFMVITVVYSLITQNSSKTESISISDLPIA